MSTKCSLAYGDKFHLYTDCLDQHTSVYLQLDTAEFEASQSHVTVRIPLAIWEYVRLYSPANYELADLSDKELHEQATKRVAEHRETMRQWKPNSPLKALIKFNGPKGVREVLAQLRVQRAAQQKLRNEVEQLRSANSPKIKIRNRLRRRKRVLLPEFKKLMAGPIGKGSIQYALDEIRGDR
jgi:hypothetical protein